MIRGFIFLLQPLGGLVLRFFHAGRFFLPLFKRSVCSGQSSFPRPACAVGQRPATPGGKQKAGLSLLEPSLTCRVRAGGKIGDGTGLEGKSGDARYPAGVDFVISRHRHPFDDHRGDLTKLREFRGG